MLILGLLDGDKAKKMRIAIINTGTRRNINGGGGNSDIEESKQIFKVIKLIGSEIDDPCSWWKAVHFMYLPNLLFTWL
ncbi:Uncharacterized protein TCM_024293 [Theobroma cacao]|uniref:Uncharacterized protein n=1 Tax=Theobroma cacao TaxID=3641 RepID=A0A061EX14_THECC|nr:Uncharacterized protein TCM_024293 [Theobroma cacao]